jgi:hypothetical protein
MLRLAGRVADGWVPSLGYLQGGPSGLAELSRLVDDAAATAGRDPRAVRRLLNVSGRFASSGTGFLQGPPEQWAEDLAGLALEHGTSGFILAADDATAIEVFGGEVAPATRQLVSAERAR